MQEYRCIACRKLLFCIAGEAVVAVKCPRCKAFNTLNINRLTVSHIQANIPNAIERPTLERPERHLIKGREHEHQSEP